MRDYGVVSPQIWIGKTGKALRGNMPAQLVALYLMTSPHANMIGVYYCPKDSIAREIGIPYEGACEALASLIEGEFCLFDEESEEVFVKRMAAFQIGEQLDAKDNRCKGVARELEKVTSDQLRIAFHAIYSVAFHIPDLPGAKAKKTRPSKAPSKPGTGSEAGSGTGDIPRSRKTNLPESFAITDRVKAWAKEKGFTNLAPQFEAFVSYAKRKGATYVDWDEALMTAIRDDWAKVRGKGEAVRGKADWATAAGFESVYEAENAGCRQSNAHLFHNGKRDEVPA